MKLLEILALFFMLYEVFKIIFAKHTYKEAKNNWKESITGIDNNEIQKENIVLKIISYLYIIFTIALLFTSYINIGLGLIVLSGITVFALFPFIKNNKDFNFKIFTFVFIDAILSIFMLSYIFNPLELLK